MSRTSVASSGEETHHNMKNATNKNVCVLGLGYVGLPTAAVLASRGYTVRGVEVNEKAAKIINSGAAHIVGRSLPCSYFSFVFIHPRMQFVSNAKCERPRDQTKQKLKLMLNATTPRDPKLSRS